DRRPVAASWRVVPRCARRGPRAARLLARRAGLRRAQRLAGRGLRRHGPADSRGRGPPHRRARRRPGRLRSAVRRGRLRL
ncbi:MAG: hypothetical protein AVDCRST_MAG16-2241, partial [uncultured Frankineae bacterium]